MKILVFVLLILFLSCGSSKNGALKKIVYMPHKQGGKVTLIIPSGFSKDEIMGGPGEYYEYTYLYKDSSLIYITNEYGAGPNYANVRLRGHYAELFDAEHKVPSDSLNLQGIDTNGLFWRNILKKNVNIGYIKVPKEKKEFYDKALSTVKYKL